MTEPRKCPRCGAPLAAEGAAEVCLRCLLALGLDAADPDDDPANAQAAAAGSGEFPGYRVFEKIGEGGCGVVYRASQEQPVRREVAIKLLKPGMDSKAVLARFEAERQALALMTHPNIARVFDAGTTVRGHPFFVMELVAGDNLLRFCDLRRLTIRQRLELFLQVCEGVRHAHLKGVIHRDLKPSNILVAEIDGEPVPKIIDFGVAKAMDHHRLGSRTIYTVFDQFVGPPAYMSPEQAGLTGDGIDARSDIYSLGVLLYELLSGRPPFAPERLRKSALDEICRVIREEEPPPSVGASLPGVEDMTATARLRLSTARRLAADLRGDLDGIVMKAPEKSPDRRYDSANDLAQDIHRHLRHEPVTARPPGVWRRLWKFTRRNKLAVVSGGLVFCSLVGGLGASLWMGRKEKLARLQLEYRAYLTDMGSACRTALHTRSSLASTIDFLEGSRGPRTAAGLPSRTVKAIGSSWMRPPAGRSRPANRSPAFRLALPQATGKPSARCCCGAPPWSPLRTTTPISSAAWHGFAPQPPTMKCGTAPRFAAVLPSRRRVQVPTQEQVSSQVS